MNKLQKTFDWIRKRCIFRYKEQANSQMVSLISYTENLIHRIQNCTILDKSLDKIITKYYFDFEFDKTSNNNSIELSMGFSEKERQLLRHNIINIYKDIIENIITEQDTIDTCSDIDVENLFINDNEISNLISSNIST